MADDIGAGCMVIAETLLLQLPENANSVFQAYTQDDSRENRSFFASSSSKEVEEIMQDNPSATSFMKLNCLSIEEDQQMLVSISEKVVGSCSLASGSFGCEDNMDDCGRKNGTSGEQLQETKDSVLDFVSGCEQKNSMLNSDEGTEIVCVTNEEIGVCGVSAECKSIEVALEAKKKQLLAKFDAGAFKDEVHTLASDSTIGILGNVTEMDESASRSLKVDAVDDTAPTDTVPVPEKGNHLVKVAESNGKKNEKQEADGKKAKRQRRKGKDGRKDLETYEILKKMPHVGKGLNEIVRIDEIQSGCQKNGNTGRMYTRGEMEALRFVNTVGQKKLWTDVYAGLGDVVMREYNNLACSRNQKNLPSKCDPSKRIGKKENASGILGKTCPRNGDAELHTTEENKLENMILINSGCREDMKVANSFVEEVCYEEDDSDEEYASIQRPAFHVEGEPDFDSGPPEDGWEYLRRVRWEATHIPKITVAKRDKIKFNKEQSVYMPQIPEIDKCPQQLLPSAQWEYTFLADFSELRKVLSYNEDCMVGISSNMQSFSIVHEQNTFSPQLAECTVSKKLNDQGTDGEFYSNELIDCSCPNLIYDLQSVANSEGSNISADPQNICPSSVADCNYPRLSAILAMDAVARVSMLRKRISLAETMTTLSKNDCVWLFALCAAVDTPLDADTCAALRSLLRKCASLRAAKSELDDEVIMLNILVTISGKYFGQLES